MPGEVALPFIQYIESKALVSVDKRSPVQLFGNQNGLFQLFISNNPLLMDSTLSLEERIRLSKEIFQPGRVPLEKLVAYQKKVGLSTDVGRMNFSALRHRIDPKNPALIVKDQESFRLNVLVQRVEQILREVSNPRPVQGAPGLAIDFQRAQAGPFTGEMAGMTDEQARAYMLDRIKRMLDQERESSG